MKTNLTKIERLKNNLKYIDNPEVSLDGISGNYCFATVLTKSKYEVCVGRMYQSMQFFNSKYPYEILVSADLQDEDLPFLVEHKIPFKKFMPLVFKDALTEDELKSTTGFPLETVLRFNDTPSKLEILKLEQYDLVCFLDADILINDNIDYLFDAMSNIFKEHLKSHPFAFFFNTTDSIFKKPRIEGELFFVKPDKNIYIKCLQYLKDVKLNDSSFNIQTDECFFEHFFTNCIIKRSYDNSYANNAICHFSGFIKFWEYSRYIPNIQRFFYFLPIEDFILNIDTIHSYYIKLDSLHREKVLPLLWEIDIITNKDN